MTSSLDCTFANVFGDLPAEAKCNAIALGSCAGTQDFLNFYKLFLCDFGGRLWIMIPFTIVLLYFIFRFICALVDEYIAASIEYLVEEYAISDAFAGVTLIALANGAGDVVTAVVASGSADGVAYNVGALFGAGLFVCTIVMTFTIRASRVAKGSEEYSPIVVEPSFIYRDIGFYLLATAYVLVCGAMGKITWWSSAIMLCLYVAFVVVVYLQDRSSKAAATAKAEVEKEEKEKADAVAAAAHKKDDGDAEAAAPRMLGTRSFKTALRRAVTLSVAKRVARQMPWQMLKNKERREEKARAEAKSFAELGAWEKFCFVTDWPFVLVRKLTILPCQPSEYDKYLTIAWPYAGIMATQMICTKSWPLHWGYACYLPVAIGWSVLFYCI
jgi:Ca2+/Na+ antiporter